MTTLSELCHVLSIIPVPHAPSLLDIAADFLAVQTSDCTKAVYRSNIKKLADYIPDPLNARLGDLIAFRDYLSETLMPASVNTIIATVRSLYTFLAQQGLIDHNPAFGLKGIKHSNETSRSYLSVEESGAVLKAPDATTARGRRDKAMLALMLINGLREIELARASVGDIIAIGEHTVLKVKGKGGKLRDAKLRDDVKNLIDDTMADRGQLPPDAPLFGMTTRGIRKRVEKYLATTKLKRAGICPHAFRHTAITHTVRSGVGILDAQDFAGHSDPRTTMRYLHDHTSLDRAAVDQNPIKVA